MIKIVEVIPSLISPSGGAEILFVDLCLEMVKDKDVTIDIVCLYDGVNERYRKKLNNSNIKIHELSKRKGVDFTCASKFKKLINSLSPNIVHLHLGVVLTYFLAFRFRKQRFKTYLTVHSVADKDDSKFVVYLRRLYGKKNLINYIGISDSISNSILECYRCDKVDTIYNGFNISLCSSEIIPVSKKEYDFICVAVFKEAKNHKLLFDAFKKLNDTIPNLTLVCVGGGHLLEQYKEYVANLGIPNVLFAGHQNDVYSFLKKSKFFVLTSFYEGNPISILEALNAGLPILAPNVGGIPDVIDDGVNGFLFKPCDIDDLVNKMKLILTYTDNEYLLIGEKNRRKATYFSIQNTSEQYIKLFRSKE
jgi:glycosyltransferase involved in cell wall biosynthesis